MALRGWQGLLAALLALGGCGTLGDDGAVQATREAMARIRADAAPAIDAASLSRETFETSAVPLIIAAPVSGEAVLLLARSGQNGDMDTFEDELGRSLSLRDGILVASRGFGDDLMGADPGNLRAALATGAGTYQREFAWLGPLDEIRHATYTCGVELLSTPVIELYGRSIATRELGEVCQRGETGFINNYWVDSRGEVVQSRQYLSPMLGQVDILRP